MSRATKDGRGEMPGGLPGDISQADTGAAPKKKKNAFAAEKADLAAARGETRWNGSPIPQRIDVAAGKLPAGVTRQAVAAVDRSKPGLVTGRLKRVLDGMANGVPLAQAAVQCGMTAHSVTIALHKPHVSAYFRGLSQVRVISELPRTIRALVDVRDQTDNQTARVSAARELNAMAAEALGVPQQSNASRAGLVIVIREKAGAEIAAHYADDRSKPLIEHDDVSRDDD